MKPSEAKNAIVELGWTDVDVTKLCDKCYSAVAWYRGQRGPVSVNVQAPSRIVALELLLFSVDGISNMWEDR